jgi:hypothetical protein
MNKKTLLFNIVYAKYEERGFYYDIDLIKK